MRLRTGEERDGGEIGDRHCLIDKVLAQEMSESVDERQERG